jgi:hypothetical protein
MGRPRYKAIQLQACAHTCNSISGLHDLHPIFSPKDFLEVLIGVKNPNSAVPSVQGHCVGGGEEGVEEGSQLAAGLMKVQMNVQSLFKLVSKWVL